MLEDGPPAYNVYMPSRNIVKEYGPDQYYHIYSRGVAKQATFLDDKDFKVFISLFARYLSDTAKVSPSRTEYPWYAKRLSLLSYCLMPNHIHLLVYQNDEKAITDFMRSLMTSYSMYFNKRYKRVGPVFQSRYLASRISQQNYLEHISRYIHLNPKNWKDYPYSSISAFLYNENKEWLKPESILSLFQDKSQYKDFLYDYEEHKQMLEEIKWELAHE